MGIDKKVYESELPPGMYRGITPVHNRIDYEFAVKVLRTDAYIRLFEDVSGLKIPDKYKQNLSQRYQPDR